MSNPVHYVDFWADDWLGGTSELTLEERGFYITAVALIYSRGGPVEQGHLKTACGIHGHTFNRLLRRLVELGKLEFAGILVGQKRAAKELQKSAKRIANWGNNLKNQNYKGAKRPARAGLTTNIESLTTTPSVVVEETLGGAAPPLPSQGDGGSAPPKQEAKPAAPTVFDDPMLKADAVAALDRCLDAIRGKLPVLEADATEPPPSDPRVVAFRGRLHRLNAIAGEHLAGALRDQAWAVLAAADSIGDPLALPDQMAADLDAIERLHFAEAAE